MSDKSKQKHADLITWRRSKLLDYLARGLSYTECSQLLQISKSLITKDVHWMAEQAKDNIKSYLSDRIPLEHEKAMNDLSLVLKSAWLIHERAEDEREKLGALALIKDTIFMKEELMANSEVIQHAIKYAESQNSKLQDIRADAAEILIDTALQIESLQKMADAIDTIITTNANVSTDATTEGEQEQQDDPE